MSSVQSEMEKAKKSAASAEAGLFLKEAGLDRWLGRGGESKERTEQRRLLFDMQFVQKRDLSKKPWPKILISAIRRNDLTFFRNLGKILGRRPLPQSKRWIDAAKVEWFLVQHWARAHDGLPKLSSLTWDGLQQVCAYALKNANLSPESVRARATRLGLKPVSSPKFSVVSIKPKLRLQRVCKRA